MYFLTINLKCLAARKRQRKKEKRQGHGAGPSRSSVQGSGEHPTKENDDADGAGPSRSSAPKGILGEEKDK